MQNNIRNNPTQYPLQIREFSISLYIILLSTLQFCEGYINRKIEKIWRRWENEKLRLIQLIDLQSMYGYENKTLLQQTGLWLNAVIDSRIYCAETFYCTESVKNY